MAVGVQSDMSMFSSHSSMPGMVPEGTSSPKNSDYRVRIQRFVVDGENFSDLAMLENLWTAGMDPNDDSIVILSNKEFTHHDVLVIVVTFMEKKSGSTNWRVVPEDMMNFQTADSALRDIDEALNGFE